MNLVVSGLLIVYDELTGRHSMLTLALTVNWLYFEGQEVAAFLPVVLVRWTPDVLVSFTSLGLRYFKTSPEDCWC